MSFFCELDKKVQGDLIGFVEQQEAKPYPHVLGEALTTEILRKFLDGDCRMSGCATDHDKNIMYLEFTFYDGGVQ